MLMSAIAGVIDLPAGQKIEQQMLNTMAFRGQGQQSRMQKESCTLLYAAGSEQTAGPIRFQYGGEDYAVLLDGCFYDTAALRKELQQAGHRFETEGDPEILLHSFLEWDTDCLDHLNGVFAGTIWDLRRKRLLLFRDPLGMRPLFYTLHRNGLIFSSEMKTILSYPTMKAELDEQGAAEVLLLGPGRTPGCGVFRGIQELKPGEFAVYEQGRLRVTQYWKLQDRVHTQSLEETAEQVRSLVLTSIRQQSEMEGTFGTCLSGGLDSSLISAVCAGAMESGHLQTFSVDYLHQEQFFQPNSFQPDEDRYYIEQMRQALQTDHHTVCLTPEQLAGALDEAMEARDLPGMGDIDASLLLFCREIRKAVPVALSGEGADEIFGGYPWYGKQWKGFPWACNTDCRLELLAPDFRKERLADYAQQRWQQAVSACDILPEQPEEERRIKQMMQLNLYWFLQTLAERNDRMSARAGLEMRVPLCTPQLAQYLYEIPWAMKNLRGREKGLLRYAAGDLLPESVLWRKKSPYPKTFDPRFGQMMEEKIHAVLEEKDNPLFCIVDRTALKEYLYQESSQPWYGQLMRRPQTMAFLLQAEAWLRRYQVNVIS